MAESLYGVMAEFKTPGELIHAAEKVRDSGYKKTDAFTPFPVEGLDDALGSKFNPLGWMVLAGGLTGMCVGIGMQWFASSVHYPISVGGKPYFSWPAFIPVTFELTILFSALTAVLGMIVLNGLPTFYHPVFHVPEFEKASSHGFFLVIEAKDARFDAAQAKQLLSTLHPVGVYDVPA